MKFQWISLDKTGAPNELTSLEIPLFQTEQMSEIPLFYLILGENVFQGCHFIGKVRELK